MVQTFCMAAENGFEIFIKYVYNIYYRNNMKKRIGEGMVRRAASMVCYEMYKNKVFSHEQLRQIQYGLEVVMGEVIKTIFMVLVIYISSFLFRELLYYGILAMGVFVSIRLYAGGYHANTQLRCFIITLGIIYAAVFMGMAAQVDFIRWGMFMVSLVIAYIYAPCVHPNQPIRSEKRRIRKKYMTMAVITIWIWISLYLPSPYTYICGAACLLQMLTTIPILNQKHIGT